VVSLTAIIPVFNGRELIPDAIDSIRRQSHPVRSILVVDDASTDGSGDVAESMGARVVRFRRNRGPSAARNAALNAADTELVAFIDADDVWMPQHCECLVDTLMSNPVAKIASSRTQLETSNSSIRYPCNAPFDALPHLVRANFVPQSAVIADRATLLDAGGYDESQRFSEDYGLWLQLALRHSFIARADVTVTRRIHEGQATWNREALLYARGWDLRLDLLRDAALCADPSRCDAVVTAMREALEIDFCESWNSADEDVFAAAAAAAALVPDSANVLRHWTRRRRYGWIFRKAAVAFRKRFTPRPDHRSLPMG